MSLKNKISEMDACKILSDKISSSFRVLSEISVESSTNSKQSILSNNKTNEVLRLLLFVAYSPYLQYNIKKIPVKLEECKGKDISDDRYLGFLQLLTKLHNREITGNKAIDALKRFLLQCSSEEFTWYSRVIEKDLRIGLAAKGINKAINDLIPIYEVLLADKIAPEDLNLNTSKALKVLPDKMVTQYKIDGYRLNLHVLETGEVLVRTRNGKIVSGYKELEEEASAKLPKGYVYDGEIVSPELFEWISTNVKNNSDSIVANRDLFSEVMSHAFSKEDNKKGIFNLFDMIPIKEWCSHKTTETYQQRLQNISTKVATLELNHIVVVPTSRVYYKNNPDDLKEIVEQFHYFLNIGWEGLMIKNLDSKYEFKRSKNLLKMKLMDCLDLEVVELFEGTGKYSGMMGGVYVNYKDNKVGVGSGWTDEQRQKYWKNPNELLGKTIEVAYQAETKNKTGGLSLSFPVFKGIRHDK